MLNGQGGTIVGIFHIRGYQHKKAKSYGPVCLILDRRVGRILLNYMKHIRILVPGYRKTNRALLTSKGTDITNYKNYVSKFLAKFKVPQLPTIITATRKTVATMVVKIGKPAKLEVLSQRMSHNVTTSQKYYRQRQKTETSIFVKVTAITGLWLAIQTL